MDRDSFTPFLLCIVNLSRAILRNCEEGIEKNIIQA